MGTMVRQVPPPVEPGVTDEPVGTALTEHFRNLADTIGRGGMKFHYDRKQSAFLQGFESELDDGLTKEALIRALLQKLRKLPQVLGLVKKPAAPQPVAGLQKALKAKGAKKEFPMSQPITPTPQIKPKSREPGDIFTRFEPGIRKIERKRERRRGTGI